MSNITGTVISVSLNTTVEKQDKTGSYPAWELVFKGDDGKVGSVQKHINGLKYTKGLKTALEGLQPGDRFVLTQEKGANGFNEVQSITKGDSAQMPDVSSNKPRTGVVTGSNYETAAERALRQKLIVKQSSLSTAVAFMEASKAKMTADEVLELAAKFNDYVWEQPSKEEEVE